MQKKYLNNKAHLLQAMNNKCLVLACLVLLMASCAPQQQAQQQFQQQAVPAAKPAAVSQPAPSQPKQEITAEVKELLDKSKTKVRSVSYRYYGPETGADFYEFYLKDSKIKYLPNLELKTLDMPDSYDTIFIDKSLKAAESHCVAAYCTYKGKKQDLNYDNVYISTIIDWVSGLTYAKKIGEEVIDDRSTWKIDSSKGTLWIDTFYGIPLKADSDGKSYRFQQISVNSVQDSDVAP